MTNKIQQCQNQEGLTSLNPKDENFNFDIWAKAVREQMLAALEKRLNSSQMQTATDG